MRVVAFGCSFTCGHGLPDLWDYKSSKYIDGVSTKSWPAQVAKLLNVEIVNCAWAGSSNKEILYKILNFEFEPNDIVLINWTVVQRSAIIRENSILQLSVHNKKVNMTSNIWNEYIAENVDLTFESHTAYMLAHLFLDRLNIYHRHLFLEHIDEFNEFAKNDTTIPVRLDWKNCSVGVDGSHPDYATYTEYANKIHAWIKHDINNNNIRTPVVIKLPSNAGQHNEE